jgi:hypothetical protein
MSLPVLRKEHRLPDRPAGATQSRTGDPPSLHRWTLSATPLAGTTRGLGAVERRGAGGLQGAEMATLGCAAWASISRELPSRRRAPRAAPEAVRVAPRVRMRPRRRACRCARRAAPVARPPTPSMPLGLPRWLNGTRRSCRVLTSAPVACRARAAAGFWG